MPERIAETWSARFYQAPFVLEGGAFNTDGEGTLLTTEQCLLHNRNLGMARRDYEQALQEWLGIEKVIWLPFGLVEDSGPLSTRGTSTTSPSSSLRAWSSPRRRHGTIRIMPVSGRTSRS